MQNGNVACFRFSPQMQKNFRKYPLIICVNQWMIIATRQLLVLFYSFALSVTSPVGGAFQVKSAAAGAG